MEYDDCDACMDGNECGDEDYDDCMENYMYDNCNDVCAEDELPTDDRSEDDDGNDSQTRNTH